jgi:hypothetical protein
MLNMRRFFARDLANEAAKHFQGTPGERIAQALRLGEEALELFLAMQPDDMSRAEAREILRRNKHRGRRPSRVMDAPRA